MENKTITKSLLSTAGGGAFAPHLEERKGALRGSFTPSLTTYKEVVYNFQENQKDYEQIKSNLDRITFKRRIWQSHSEKKIIYYGLTKKQLEVNETKLMLQRRFLNLSVLYDKQTSNMIPLRDLVISANHSPHRYYSEVQNRVNTLTGEAERKCLVPIFMTITLPSEYHPFMLRNKNLVINPKFDGSSPREAVKALTKRFARLRNDRALRDIEKDNRMYFRVNEPHQSGTPHTHILYYIPKESVKRVISAFRRLFPQKGNDIQNNLRNAVAYVMKYINKTLPKSKSDKLSKKDRYLNAWYSHHRVTRFSSSRTLAPLYLYRLLHHRYSLRALTKIRKDGCLRVFRPVDNLNKIAEIFEGEELIYMKNENYTLEKHRGIA
jgi:hypothetical protein